jgi:hypothetical protein
MIVEALYEAGFAVQNRGYAGRGRKDYTSGGRLKPPYDLSNWMWIAAFRDGAYVSITLQVMDQNPAFGSIHALIDRLGVEVYRAGDPLDPDDPLREKHTTAFELPLSDEDMAALLDMIESKIAKMS